MLFVLNEIGKCLKLVNDHRLIHNRIDTAAHISFYNVYEMNALNAVKFRSTFLMKCMRHCCD